jgi:hypothetical protein
MRKRGVRPGVDWSVPVELLIGNGRAVQVSDSTFLLSLMESEHSLT